MMCRAASPTVYANTITRTATDAETGEETEQASPFMKGYTVQCAADRRTPAQLTATANRHRPRSAHRARGRILRRHRRGDPARRQPGLLHRSPRHRGAPPFDCFHDRESYYGTLAHELTHVVQQDGEGSSVMRAPACNCAAIGARDPTAAETADAAGKYPNLVSGCVSAPATATYIRTRSSTC